MQSPQTRGSWTPDAIRASMKLYAVSDSSWLRGRSFESVVEDAITGGITFLQLREKEKSTDELVSLAIPLKALCTKARIPFVIDDDVEAARRSGADGVHVGQADAACRDARAWLGDGAIIGVSVQTVEQALRAEADGADYLGAGAVIATPTKPDADLVTLEELRAICNAVRIPVVAIGGLNSQTIPRLAGTGIDGVAVVSAIFAASDAKEATKELRRTISTSLDSSDVSGREQG